MGGKLYFNLDKENSKSNVPEEEGSQNIWIS